MIEIIRIVMPPFFIVIVGWLACQSGYLKREIVPALTEYTLKVSIPAILMVAIAAEPFSRFLHYSTFFLILSLLSVAVMLMALAIGYFLLRLSITESAFFALASAMSNAGMLVLPLLYEAFGRSGAVYAAMSNISVSLILVPIAVFIVEWYRDDQTSLIKALGLALAGIAKTPYFYGVVLGLMLSACRVTLSGMIGHFVTLLAAATTPVALFAIGMDVNYQFLLTQRRVMIAVSTIKLIVMPLLACLVAKVLHMSSISATALLICCAAPTAKGVFILTKQRALFCDESAAAVMGTTILAIITITLMLFLGHLLWPDALAQSGWRFHRLSGAV